MIHTMKLVDGGAPDCYESKQYDTVIQSTESYNNKNINNHIYFEY